MAVVVLAVEGVLPPAARAGGPPVMALAEPMAAPSWDRGGGSGRELGAKNARNAGSPEPRSRENATGAGQHRQEREDLRRQDLATELAALGVPLAWRDHTLATLVDWLERLRAARALRQHHGVDVDWRISSLESLTDMRLRASKAAVLSRFYGIQVDWQRYTWVALESLRRQVATLPGQGANDKGTGDDLALPDFAARSSAAAVAGSRGQWRDPDGIMAPTFALESLMAWRGAVGVRGTLDRDAILVPSFASIQAPAFGPDDLLSPWTSPRSPRAAKGAQLPRAAGGPREPLPGR